MKKIAMLFPGQGSQGLKMGEYLYHHYEAAKQIYDSASDILGFDVAKLCIEGRMTKLVEFRNMQIAIVTTEVAMFQVFYETYHVLPAVALGHSIGEYAAFVCSGAIEFCDILKIISKRSDLIEGITAKKKSRMTVVENMSKDQIQAMIRDLQIDESVYISCCNSSSQFTLSGLEKQLDLIETKLVKAGACISPLSFSPPIHSPLVEEVKAEFFEFLQEFTYYTLRFPVISNVTGEKFDHHESLANTLANQLVKPVLYQEALQYMLTMELDCMIEMSQRPVLSMLLINKDSELPTFCYHVDEHRMKLRHYMQSNTH